MKRPLSLSTPLSGPPSNVSLFPRNEPTTNPTMTTTNTTTAAAATTNSAVVSHISLPLSLFFLFLSLSFLHFKFSLFPSLTPTLANSNTSTPNPNPNSNQSHPPTATNYIVRFTQYKHSIDHQNYLQSRIKSSSDWKWIPRNNPASKYPTDFGIISVPESGKESLIEEIRGLGLVKDVNLDLSYRRRELLSEGGRKRETTGAFVDGKKRPGKIFTSMSFSEKDGRDGEDLASGISNSSLDWGRHLLMQAILSSLIFMLN